MLAFAYLCVFFYCFPIFFLVFPNLEKWNCLSIYNLRLYVYIYIYMNVVCLYQLNQLFLHNWSKQAYVPGLWLAYDSAFALTLKQQAQIIQPMNACWIALQLTPGNQGAGVHCFLFILSSGRWPGRVEFDLGTPEESSWKVRGQTQQPVFSLTHIN